ncbi:MAG: sulfate adenylyltransferase subunit CysD, partial [Pseudomonadota bacterium]
MNLPSDFFVNRLDAAGNPIAWDTKSVHDELVAIKDVSKRSLRTTERLLEQSRLFPPAVEADELVDEFGVAGRTDVAKRSATKARSRRQLVLTVQRHSIDSGGDLLVAHDARGARRWLFLSTQLDSVQSWTAFLGALVGGRSALLIPHGSLVADFKRLTKELKDHDLKLENGAIVRLASFVYSERTASSRVVARAETAGGPMTHLDRLEAESMFIIREVMASASNPVFLYSVGKDSSVMLHLARKAFAPSSPPFPLMHVDTQWEFQAVYDFRDAMARDSGMELIVHINPEGIEKNINPFDHGSALHTDVMKTQALKQALDQHGFDVAFGGARRDEEKSRAKERVFSFRTDTHRWDPKNQRPELWNLYNAAKKKGEGIRVFPLSNWTERDLLAVDVLPDIQLSPI